MRKILRIIDKSLAAVETTLIIAIVAVMVTMAFLQVILRNMDAGLLWADIFLRHLVLWVGFVGASLATRDEKHISIDALSRLAPENILPYIRMAVDLITMVVCLVLADAGYQFLQYEIEAGTTIFGETPAWPFQIIIPIGFALIAFRFFLKFLGRLTDRISPLAETGENAS